jgi:hypothetical protein
LAEHASNYDASSIEDSEARESDSLPREVMTATKLKERAKDLDKIVRLRFQG